MKKTYEQLEAENKKLEAENKQLKEEHKKYQDLLTAALQKIKQLEEKIKQLEEKINTNSKNSSKAPSTDQKANTEEKSPKKRPKRTGKSRELYPADRVDHHVECTRSSCPHCESNHLKTQQDKCIKWQQVELPEVKAIVTQYNCHKYECQDCGKKSSGQLPTGVPFSAFGPKLMALVACLTGRYHIAKREAIDLISSLCDIEISTGSVVNIEEKVCLALEESYKRIHSYVIDKALAKHFDETGWRTNGKRRYAWIATSELAAYYRIDPSRSQEAFKKLTGGKTKMASVTDRYGAYNAIDGPHQYCLAHLIRDFHKFAERADEEGKIASKIEENLRETCKIHATWKKQEITKRQYAARMSYKKKQLKNLLEEGFLEGAKDFSGLCNRLSDRFTHLFTFLSVSGMDPTNNLAERDLRKLVVWRKKSYGTRSEKGQMFVERISSVVETLKKSSKNILSFLTESIQAFYAQKTAPFILEKQGF